MGMTSKEYHKGYQQGCKDTKEEYEARLKADMVAILTDIQLEIEELYPNPELNTYYRAVDDCSNLIQQKIDALKMN